MRDPFSTTPPEPVPVTILTGFLGAGKTSVLNHILKRNQGRRIAVMVNDFGAINIDAALIVGVEGEQSVSLSNGCICCTIRDDLLVETLRLLARPEPPDYIIVETSGVSDPIAVAMTFREMEIGGAIHIDSILTVIDADQFEDALRDYEDLALNQLRAADIVILNKVDLVQPVYREALKNRWIRKTVPQARIVETTFGAVPLELVIGVGSYDAERLAAQPRPDIHVHEQTSAAGETPPHEHHDHEQDAHEHHDHTLVFDTWSWRSDRPLSFERLRHTLKSLPVAIYRVKGVVQLLEAPHERVIVHMAGKRLSMFADEKGWGDNPPQCTLVMIGAQGKVKAAVLQAALDKCHQPEPDTLRWGWGARVEERRY